MSRQTVLSNDRAIPNGITMREYYAGVALQGLLSAKAHGPVVAMAIGIADSLIQDLNRDPKELAEYVRAYLSKQQKEFKKLRDSIKSQQGAKPQEEKT